MSTGSRWRWVGMTGLIAAAIGSYGIINHDAVNDETGAERAPLPGYYVKDAILTVTEPDGSTRLRLAAKRIDEEVATRSFGAETVAVDYLALPGRPWTLIADRAHVPEGLTIVELTGNVTVRGEQNGRAGVILTESLTLDTATNTAHTLAPVAIELGRQRLTAVGLKADLRAGHLQLESRVHGQFQRQ